MSTHPDTLPETANSRDGTTITYDRIGSGPPLIMVLGAFNNRFTGAALAAALADRVSVFNYDRRGRGDSGDTVPYAVEREIEDIAALSDVVGGPVSIFGFSAGAVLALRAAAAGLTIDKLILFGTPLISDATRSPLPSGIAERIKVLVQDNRRGEAVELFQTDAVGMPRKLVEELRNAPFRPALEAMAHTLFYDLSIIGDGSIPDELPTINTPTLVMDGGSSPPWIRHTAEVLAKRLPNGVHESVPGLTQDLVPDLLAPPLLKFLAG